MLFAIICYCMKHRTVKELVQCILLLCSTCEYVVCCSSCFFLCRYLLQSGSKGPPNSIMDIMPMIGGRVYSSLERSHLMLDVYEGELVKELQNGRLFKLLAKLGTITERPE